MDYQPFRVTLYLATPFHLGSTLTLDGLLSAAVFNATGLKGEETIPYIPLERQDGIFKASSMFCHRYIRHVPVVRIMSFNSENDMSMHMFYPKLSRYTYIDQKRGPYKRNLSTYSGIESRRVYFWGLGDAQKVSYLLRTFIPGIGKRANGGAGQITKVEISETDNDLSWVTSSGKPARPLPIELWQKIGGDASVPVSSMAVSLPYWQSAKVPAVFPIDITIPK